MFALNTQRVPSLLPDPVFKASDNLSYDSNNRLINKISRFVWNLLSIIIFPIGIARLAWGKVKQTISKLFLPAAGNLNGIVKLNNQRKEFLKNEPRVEQVTLQTADGVKLDTVNIKSEDSNCKKWIVFFLPNLGRYEEGLSHFKEISDDTGVNVLVGNYRGVMRSEGFSTSSNDLFLDGDAMIQYLLKEKKVRPEDILIFGKSIGGAVAAEVASRYPGLHLCVDRSFSNTIELLKSFFIKPLAYLIDGIVRLSGWRFNSDRKFEKVHENNGRTCIITGENDNIISLNANIQSQIKKEKIYKHIIGPFGHNGFINEGFRINDRDYLYYCSFLKFVCKALNIQMKPTKKWEEDLRMQKEHTENVINETREKFSQTTNDKSELKTKLQRLLEKRKMIEDGLHAISQTV